MFCYVIVAASFPDVSLFLRDKSAKDNGNGKVASPLSLSRGPSRFKLVTSRTCFALALTSLEASEEEAVIVGRVLR